MNAPLPLRAAALWQLDPAQITLAARRENIVFRANTPEGCFALRQHRQGYRNDAQLLSELDWMAHLAANGVAVPQPKRSGRGNFVETVDGVQYDLLTWLPGQMLGAQGQLDAVTDRCGFARQLGSLLAQLHDISDAWVPPAGFQRPAWDVAGLVGESPLWGRYWAHPDLTGPQRQLLRDVRDKASQILAQCAGDMDYGLIHADAITENILVDGGQIYLIDFDDGGWGFRDFELATFLMRQIDAPDYPQIRDALLQGYAQRRAVAHDMLQLMLVLRALTYVGWVITRIGEPGAAERSQRAIATAQFFAEEFLNGGSA